MCPSKEEPGAFVQTEPMTREEFFRNAVNILMIITISAGGKITLSNIREKFTGRQYQLNMWISNDQNTVKLSTEPIGLDA